MLPASKAWLSNRGFTIPQIERMNNDKRPGSVDLVLTCASGWMVNKSCRGHAQPIPGLSASTKPLARRNAARVADSKLVFE